ncbi:MULTISPECIES: aspartate aminotransferase family protein [Streptomyces]|uniref:Aspartate aminotransferase family protein n=1 Tax=Streptomyces dengpaensis TaxID=2049881 RepID=A0ABM6SKZ5_9ACTN|nr:MULTISPECIES: aminotransferase class III-fold pyridoxal phosphate-dependent enzyme [Streptomyces]AVH55168.1 aspartate aminotransferase family protein [Streptomyces dengpaensis]PIB07460.1 aspartate aminotransferase family protein [Streptomyces sp. HG99]
MTAPVTTAVPTAPGTPDTPGLADRGHIARLYREHLSSGRAVLGSVLGGMLETASDGAWVYTEDGRPYLDFGGYGVFILGHRHPAVTAAVHRQVDTHPLAGRVFLEPVAARAAGALAARTPAGLDHVHFVNSGAEATEAGLKLARAHGHTALVSTAGGYHGKTLGALTATANPKYQQPFQPLLPDSTVVPYGDTDAMAAALAGLGRRACVIVEPVQGEGGVRIPPPGYLAEVSRLCRTYGAFLIVDEIQTGLGRLGSWWGMEAEGAERAAPDVLLVGKGLSGGVVPVAAMVATEAAYRPFSRDPYLHTSTFAASPIACAAAWAAVETLDREDLVGRAQVLGDRLLTGVRAACAPYSGGLVHEVRGRGLLIALEFTEERTVGELILELVGRGVVVNHSLNATRVLRLTPPAIIGDEEVRLFLAALADGLRAVATRVG